VRAAVALRDVVGEGEDVLVITVVPFESDVDPDLVPEVWAGVTGVFRDYGYRRARNHARLKFLIADWGPQRFREVLEKEYLEYALPDGPAFIAALFGILRHGSVVVMINPEAPADRRYAMLTFRSGTVNDTLGYYTRFSADGYTWTEITAKPQLLDGDVSNLAWDPVTKRYVATIKKRMFTARTPGTYERSAFVATSPAALSSVPLPVCPDRRACHEASASAEPTVLVRACTTATRRARGPSVRAT
jgi:hypothetical protein